MKYVSVLVVVLTLYSTPVQGATVSDPINVSVTVNEVFELNVSIFEGDIRAF